MLWGEDRIQQFENTHILIIFLIWCVINHSQPLSVSRFSYQCRLQFNLKETDTVKSFPRKYNSAICILKNRSVKNKYTFFKHGAPYFRQLKVDSGASNLYHSALNLLKQCLKNGGMSQSSNIHLKRDTFKRYLEHANLFLKDAWQI